ncbi:phosphatase PAP2 family protein [Methylomicrobium sp. RS1]|uniref:phosphatase PAP2 family protein n=1 Tax=Candidatus Methylomicrobium oryzae TaxID=2802053 RepID=UPI001923DB0E|nr:phosphatase PAP2 family protein [Methylomicrobium sp. RS1]
MPLFISLFIFLSLFTNMKGLISYYGTYSWDPIWAETDRKLHFGVDPWRLLQPLLGFPYITKAINILYNFWLPMLIFFLYWQLVSHRDPGLRMQFFFTFFIVWGVNGTLVAILFASGGPCYFEMLTGSHYFAEQMNYLHEVNRQYGLWSVTTQEMLRDMYQKNKIMIGVGISAMPSMHVATAFLFYLLTARLNKKVGRVFGLYCLFILLGSVHLGWHYAVDGYVSIISTGLYWKLAGIIAKKSINRSGICLTER